MRYYERYIAIAKAERMGFVLESPTWRASADWGAKLGYSADDIVAANRDSLQLMHDLRARHETAASPMVVSGCIGPRGDGYDPGQVMTALAAEDYHRLQIEAFADAGADMVSAITMTNANEAIGITRAAAKAGMPVVISFTVETDGRLPTGQSLVDAICEVDVVTSKAPAYYMINCAHPTHFDKTLRQRAVDEAHRRAARQRLQAQPPGAERFSRPRCRQSGGAGRPVSRPAAPSSADQRAGRLLRHRPPPRRMHRPRLPRGEAGGVSAASAARSCSGPRASSRAHEAREDARGPRLER